MRGENIIINEIIRDGQTNATTVGSNLAYGHIFVPLIIVTLSP